MTEDAIHKEPDHSLFSLIGRTVWTLSRGTRDDVQYVVGECQRGGARKVAYVDMRVIGINDLGTKGKRCSQ